MVSIGIGTNTNSLCTQRLRQTQFEMITSYSSIHEMKPHLPQFALLGIQIQHIPIQYHVDRQILIKFQFQINVHVDTNSGNNPKRVSF
jgi:hypothetical protein